MENASHPISLRIVDNFSYTEPHSYEDLDQHWKSLAANDDRISIRTVGITSEGRRLKLFVISPPEGSSSTGKRG